MSMYLQVTWASGSLKGHTSSEHEKYQAVDVIEHGLNLKWIRTHIAAYSKINEATDKKPK